MDKKDVALLTALLLHAPLTISDLSKITSYSRVTIWRRLRRLAARGHIRMVAVKRTLFVFPP
ncbi:AsnC family transcriptional regulator [Pyrobaculum sp.]|uniref:AsnC family transcriptional regulator n=1 Tax=Pyrobaculum sp. TaxID=2004705 RepID=UPI0038621B07